MQLPYRGSGRVYFNAKEYQCDLYYSEKLGGIVLKITTIDENTIGSFLQLPLEISYLSGQLDSGFKFTLLNLIRTGMENLISYGRSVYTFRAKYLLSGVEAGNQEGPTFLKVQYTLSNIIEWGNESAYAIGEKFEITHNADDIKKQLYSDQGLTITYIVRTGSTPLVDYDVLKERITLEQHGIIEISSSSEEPLCHFDNSFMRLKRLIEIASFRKVNVEKVQAYSSKILYTIGENTIERAVDIYGTDIQEYTAEEISPSHPWKWIGLQELIDNNSFALYFDKHEKIAPIIELFLEPFHAENFSRARVFLNIVQALETYHSRFITNDLNEFKLRIKEMLKNVSPTNAKSYYEYLLANSRTFITLESRIADLLLANWKIHFDTGEIKQMDFPAVIAYTRHYYTHYDERIKTKHKVLSDEELQFYNRSLLQILEYYILLELGFSENDVGLKRRLTERWGNVSQDLEILKISRTQ